MKRTKSSETSSKMIERIISVAYNDTNIFEKGLVYLASLTNNKVKAELESYRRIAGLVHTLKEDVCPEKLLINLKTKNIPSPEIKKSFITDLFSLVFNRPIASALTTIMVVLIIVATIIFNRPIERKYSDHELQLADKQARHALQLISTIMSETQLTLKNEILTDRVAKPIHEGIEIVNTLLKEK